MGRKRAKGFVMSLGVFLKCPSKKNLHFSFSSAFPISAGHWAVVREGLTNPWIPDNWSWGGVASSHCPVLAEFYMERDWNRKDAIRNGNGVTVERSDSNVKHER